MKITITQQRLDILGSIWQPGAGVCAQSRNLNADDLGNIEDPTDRDSVAHWLSLHSGDFQSVEDFRADFHLGDVHIVHAWAQGEDSEVAFNDAMYPAED